MMRSNDKARHPLSRRALAIILVITVFLSMILAVVSGIIFVSVAGNPSKVGALNQSSTVQQINLMPVEADVAYVDSNGNVTGYSRTTLKAGTNTDESYKYSKITVNDDESVDFTITANNSHNVTSTNNTAFVEAFTLINQRINLAENPWLMTRWSGSGRVNGRIYFTVTKNGVEYGPGGVTFGTVTDSKGKKVSELTTWSQEDLLKVNSSTKKLNVFALTLSNIINNNSAGYKYTNQTQTDFNASSVQDYTVDLYKYVNEQVNKGNISLSTDHWPSGTDWKDSTKNYITIYMSCQITASEAGKQLTAGTNVHWEQFSLGREVLDRPASLLPRSAEFMNITDVNESNGVDYGRVSANVDGTVTFSNTAPAGSGKSVLFGWNLRRYFNASELESLHIEASFSGMDSDDFDIETWFGGRTTTYVKKSDYPDSEYPGNKYVDQTGQYNYRGTNPKFQTLMKDYSRSKSTTSESLTAVVDFNRYITNPLHIDDVHYPTEYASLFPEDSLIFVGDIKLTLPAGSKITFTRLEFQVENEEIPATKSDTAYPWYSENTPDGLPPVGTPTYSTALNGSSGRSYNWAASAEDAPIVAQKVDLLSMKTYAYKQWDDVVISSATDTTDVDYSRESNGASIYSSKGKSINTYYKLMRWGETTDSSKWNRNFYTYINVKETPYLYYSYELIDENTSSDNTVSPMAGFYFHFQNSRRDKYAESENSRPYAYQYYLDHSGIALNECSSMFAIGSQNNNHEYGAKAVLSNKTSMTGCIDISSLWVDGLSNESGIANGNHLMLEALRIYLGPDTKIKINYFFFGSQSLSEEVIGSSFPTEGGVAYPWATTKQEFDDGTNPDSSTAQFTFANKVDVLKDLQDRIKIGNSSATGIPNAAVDSETGAVTLTVNDTSSFSTGYLTMAGYDAGFDHHWRVQVADDGDLSSIRYLNYSVDAPEGMRWALMFMEHGSSTSDQIAITTWCDSDARWNDNTIDTSPSAGKSHFRILTNKGYTFPNDGYEHTTEYDNFWVGDHNDSWRLYAIPGSQTGCIDLRQVLPDFEWNNILKVYLVAYRDPQLELVGDDSASVTFNYVYLTSESIQKSGAGKPALTPGASYNWGGTEVNSPINSVGTTSNFIYGTATDLHHGSGMVDYFPNGLVDFMDFDPAVDQLLITDDSGKGSYTLNADNTFSITSTAGYRMEITYDDPTVFDLARLEDLYLSISSQAPYKIAFQLGTTVSDTISWANTSDNFSGYFTIANDRVTNSSFAGYYPFSSQFTNLTDTERQNVYLKKMIIAFDGGMVDGAAAKFTCSSMMACNPDVNLSETPYLYYSYRFIDKETGKTVTTITNDDNTKTTVDLRVGMSLIENNTYYYLRNTAGSDSTGLFGTIVKDENGNSVSNGNLGQYNGANYGFGNPSFIRLWTGTDTTTEYGQKCQAGKLHDSKYYRVYGAETGCIDLSKLFVDHSDSSVCFNRLRFYLDPAYYNSDKYEFVVDYLFLGSASGSTTSFSKKWSHASDLAPTPADFRDHVVAPDTDVTGGSVIDVDSLKIDLDETPYLFYSIRYNTGDTGTFGLKASRVIGTEVVDGEIVDISTLDSFYRDVGRTDGLLLSEGSSPAQYLQQSETGCIDVRNWYIKQGKFAATTSPKIITVEELTLWGSGATINYMYFGAHADKTIDLITSEASGYLDNGLPTRAWVVPIKTSNYAELKPSGNIDTWDVYRTDTNANANAASPTTNVKFKKDITGEGFNDLWLQSSTWSQLYLRYGNIINKDKSDTFSFCTTGNNQMSGLTIDLNETPYLHFSFDQPENSRTSIILQLNNFTSVADLVGKPANEVRPWLSGYLPTSPAGQLINVVAEETSISYYKDIDDSEMPVFSGAFGGVIDLRSWYTVTNGCDNVINLESVRLYTQNPEEIDGVKYTGTDMKVNYLYLSSSASAAYSVTFHKNDGSDKTYTQYVLQNANEQYVSDEAVKDFKSRDGYTFVGWYTDPTCENYFDIQGTPMTGNVDLYARWIDNSTVTMGEDVKEINLLAQMTPSNMTVESNNGTLGQNSSVTMDKEALTITNNENNSLVVTFPINKTYSVTQLRSLFMGFDTDVTCKGYNELDANNEIIPGKQGFDIILNAKSSTTRSYSLIQQAFANTFLTSDKLLTAAPHDGEAAFYTYLGVRDDLPVRENEAGLIEVKSVTLAIPAGVCAEIRYIKSGNEMSLMGNTDTRAPQTILGETFDMLSNWSDDESFVISNTDIVYDELESKSLTYLGQKYSQAAIHGNQDGFAHLGGLYSYTIDMTIVDSGNEYATNANGSRVDNPDRVRNPGRYLYFSIDQSEKSNFTFALYASFSGLVEGNTSGTADVPVYDVHMPKSVSYYDAASGQLVSKSLDDDSTTFVPVDTAYINGDLYGCIDLYEWYKDALTPYRSVSIVQSVEILGLRLFTDSRTTDTTINYMFIGSEEREFSRASFTCYVEYPYLKGHAGNNFNPTAYAQYRHELGVLHRGDTMHVSLEDLTDLYDVAPIGDPETEFLGWQFSDMVYNGSMGASALVYWNPNATNGNMYSAESNPGGSWSISYVEGFVTNQKSVFFTFTTNNGNTQVITPVFGTDKFTPTLTAEISGTGSVEMLSSDATAVGNNVWTTAYGNELVIRANGANFAGWYNKNGVLLSLSKDYHVQVTADTHVIARFVTPDDDELLEYLPQEGRTIVWLQSTTGTAGQDFKLQSVNGGDIILKDGTTVSVRTSNINDVTGKTQIACYWNIADGQLLKAIAPDDYHWEQLLSDGTSVRVSDGEEYLFIASTNIKLVAVSNTDDFDGTVLIDEFAFDDNRDDTDLRFNGQVICKADEELVSCGLVFADFKNHDEVPSIDCASSTTVSATAWNSTTGQFVVEFSIADSPEYVIRGYAIVRNTVNGEYIVRYSQCIASVF